MHRLPERTTPTPTPPAPRPSPPFARADIANPTDSSSCVRMMASNIAVFGGNGLTGSEVVYQALDRGAKVTAFCRDPSKLSVRACLAVSSHVFFRCILSRVGCYVRSGLLFSFVLMLLQVGVVCVFFFSRYNRGYTVCAYVAGVALTSLGVGCSLNANCSTVASGALYASLHCPRLFQCPFFVPRGRNCRPCCTPTFAQLTRFVR